MDRDNTALSVPPTASLSPKAEPPLAPPPTANEASANDEKNTETDEEDAQEAAKTKVMKVVKEERVRLRKIADEEAAFKSRMRDVLVVKWKVKKTDQNLNLSAKVFLEKEVELIGHALNYSREGYTFKSLSLHRCFIACKDMKTILLHPKSKFIDNNSLLSLDLSFTKIGDEGIRYLQIAFIKNKTITSLDCRNISEITDVGCSRLLSLVYYSGAKTVDRSESKSPRFFAASASGIKKNLSVAFAKKLQRSPTPPRAEPIARYPSALRASVQAAATASPDSSFTEPIVIDAQIEEEVNCAVAPLCPSIKTLNGLPVHVIIHNKTNTLTLKNLGLGNVEAYILKHILPKSIQLESINLSGNKFKATDLASLKLALSQLPKLKTLDLSCNPLLHNAGGFECTEILKACKSLVTFQIISCELTNEESTLIQRNTMSSARSLCDALHFHNHILELNLDDNGIDVEIMNKIANRIKVNRALLHTSSHFEEYVNDKYNLKPYTDTRVDEKHVTSVKAIDNDYFKRERIGKLVYSIGEGEAPTTHQSQNPITPIKPEIDTGKGLLVKTKGVKEVWYATENVYKLEKAAALTDVTSFALTRCGCIGCFALTRCENQGAYKRIGEAVDVIRSGVSFQEALKVLRKDRVVVAKVVVEEEKDVFSDLQHTSNRRSLLLLGKNKGRRNSSAVGSGKLAMMRVVDRRNSSAIGSSTSTSTSSGPMKQVTEKSEPSERSSGVVGVKPVIQSIRRSRHNSVL